MRGGNENRKLIGQYPYSKPNKILYTACNYVLLRLEKRIRLNNFMINTVQMFDERKQDMVIGGTDTSSNTIEFAMAEVMHNPEIMKRVQEELEVVVGKDNVVEESHIHELPYLHAVMKETLRLHTALPLLVPHCPSQTTNVGGYTIPKGSRVFINVWAIHRDPSIWEKPLEFDPTRFLDANWDFSGNDFNYFPFGSGRRICAGIAMAERTVLYFVATLLHLFDWTIPQGEMLDTSEKFGIVLKKKTPLVAIPTPRLSHPELYN